MKLTQDNIAELNKLTVIANTLAQASSTTNDVKTKEAFESLARSVVALAADVVSPVKVLTLDTDHLSDDEVAELKRVMESHPIFAGNITKCVGCEAGGKLPEHSSECQFEYFLCHSGLGAETDEVKAKLRRAFEAGQ